MSFVILVLAVLLVHHHGDVSRWQRDTWLLTWRQWLGRQPWLAKVPSGELLMAVFAPALAVMLVMWLFGGWLWGLAYDALGFVVLVYAFGRGHVDQAVQTYREALERDDVQAAYHDAASFNLAHRESAAENWRQLHNQVVATVAYRYFERYFPVIFWFLAIGAPGAVLYRLALLYREQLLDDPQQQADVMSASRLVWLLEWLPLRLLGLGLALVGNFSTALHTWRKSLWDRMQGAEVWAGRYACDALNIISPIDDSPAQLRLAADEMAELKTLFDRALVALLALVALVVIL